MSSTSSNISNCDTRTACYILIFIAFPFYIFGFLLSLNSLPDVPNDVVKASFHWFHPGGNDIDNRALLRKEPSQEVDMEGQPLIAFGGLQQEVIPKVDSIENEQRVAQETIVDGIRIPTSTWPVSIRYEDEENLEEIIHPGDETTTITVPKFWSLPLMDGQLMTPAVAARIGTYVNGHVDTDLTQKGNPDDRTIFLAIASYRDWQCRDTVESIFNRAKFPNRVRVGVVDQIDKDDDPSCGIAIDPCDSNPNQALCKYIDHIDVVELESHLAVGPVFARHLGHRLYRGEYYAMQVDAHVTFAQDWDADIIIQHEATHNEMAVLTTYLSDIEGSLDEKTGHSLRDTRPVMCNTDYEGEGKAKHLRHGAQPEAPPTIVGSPQLQPYWAAGFSFARGHFLINVPYDLYAPMIFQGEEMSIGIRAFTYGYDHYAPERSICFHTYAIGKNAKKRNKVKHFWENQKLYKRSGMTAMKRILGVIGMNPEVDPSEWKHDEQTRYGVGKVRKLSKFYETFGINVIEKVVEQKLCQFVDYGHMHNQFTKKLRADTMGIDYSKIDFKFKEKDWT